MSERCGGSKVWRQTEGVESALHWREERGEVERGRGNKKVQRRAKWVKGAHEGIT